MMNAMKRNYFNYKKIRDKYLLTNDLGRYIFLTKDEFLRFVTNKLDPQEELAGRLKDEYFLYEGSAYDFVEKAGAEFREYRRNLFQGASLHIFVLTEYSCAVTPQVRQTGNRLSGLAGTAYASLLT